MAHNTPTTAESLKIYLQNQINQTDAEIIRITQNLIRLEKDYEEAQSRNSKIELVNLIDERRLELENYHFRLDFLQNRWEELHNLV